MGQSGVGHPRRKPGTGHRRENHFGGGAAQRHQNAQSRPTVAGPLLPAGPGDGQLALPARRRPAVGPAQRRRPVREPIGHRHQNATPDADDPRGQHRQWRTDDGRFGGRTGTGTGPAARYGHSAQWQR